MTEALGFGSFLIDHANDVVAARGDDAALEIDAVDWLPASDPPFVRDGLNFLGHLKGWSGKMGRPLPDSIERIIPYTHQAGSMAIGHGAEVPWPGYIQKMDYELELGWVIGRQTSNLTPDRALDALFGVTIYNDFSARDLQHDELPIGMGCTKSKNFAQGIGPWITTKDEFDDLYAIPMQARVNGQVTATGDSGGVLWTLDKILAFVSLGERLMPGDVIGSGTIQGGSAWEHDIALKPGDTIELEAGGIGTLRNTFGARQEGLWWPTPQPGTIV
ncbi:fumarylacetoacetate hydrolase family protein [Salipiger sp. IMCC34102]|uniref:fumarylacetoacetate hydrolase family protein n=1 Tax=Salipiger sp. IMCC34102 TaxID=2510647 RepID=UPI001A93990C|nr:fumarylacetoacetate hydrolase family protein [Salipiger sp. IMCC34102]